MQIYFKKRHGDKINRQTKYKLTGNCTLKTEVIKLAARFKTENSTAHFIYLCVNIII